MMYTYSNSTISTILTVPNCEKDNEESLNKHNRCLVEKVKEVDVPFNIIKISKNKLEKILQNEITVKIQRKLSFQTNNLSSRKKEYLNLKKDWDRIPQEVRDEVLKFSKQKKIKKCVANNFSCKYTQELIRLYHNAQLLREKAKQLELIEDERLEIDEMVQSLKIGKNIKKLDITEEETKIINSVEKLEIINSHKKSEGNKNYNNDFCEKFSISSVLMTEIKNKNDNVKELKNICEKGTEKLKIHEESNFRNAKCLTDLKKQFQEIQKIVNNFGPLGKIFQLKNEQKTIDAAFMNRALFLEEDYLCKAKEEIQKRLKCKEERTQQDKSNDLERSKERRIDTLLVLKSVNLMENYIQDLKSQV